MSCSVSSVWYGNDDTVGDDDGTGGMLVEGTHGSWWLGSSVPVLLSHHSSLATLLLLSVVLFMKFFLKPMKSNDADTLFVSISLLLSCSFEKGLFKKFCFNPMKDECDGGWDDTDNDDGVKFADCLDDCLLPSSSSNLEVGSGQ